MVFILQKSLFYHPYFYLIKNIYQFYVVLIENQTLKTLRREGVGTSNFTTMTGHFFQNIKIVFLVHHYYVIRTSKVSFQFITTTTIRTSKVSFYLLVHHYYFRCSDFTYGVKKDHNVKNQNINYLWHITYGYQGLGVRLGSFRLGQASLGSITLSQVRLSQVQSGQRVLIIKNFPKMPQVLTPQVVKM